MTVPAQVRQDAGRLLIVVDRIQASVNAADWPGARDGYKEFDDLWDEVEDGFRDASRDAYRAIEATMRRVQNALQGESTSEANAELQTLRDQLWPFASAVEGKAGAPAATAHNLGAGSSGGLGDLMATLNGAIRSAQGGDARSARDQIQRFQDQWLDVEGQVKTRDASVYRSTEDRMAEVASLLKAEPAKFQDAAVVMELMRQDLAPMAEQPARYGVFDAAIILLREGLEALLVVVALLAFLVKSGHKDKQGWIWGGAAVGILVSVLVAAILRWFFTSVTAGVGREMVEGISALIAAAMLIYVSYWLHSKASLSAWHKYVNERVSSALARGGLISLAAMSFLAVFREGAETVLFYVGMASAIELPDLLLGIGLGALGLLIVGVALLGFGLRIPLRPFFLVSSWLLFYLAFKFVGAGVHALQVAGISPATPAPIPAIEAIGLFPTWETTLPQLLVLTGVLAVVLWPRLAPAQRSAPVPS